MTKPDLSRQSIIPSGNTASFDGSISIGEKLLVNNIEFAVSGITSGQTLVYNSSLNKLLPTSIDLNASSTLSGMTDVNFTTLVSGDTIVWNSATNKWENNNIVLNTDSIINTSTVTGSTTTNALDNLNTNKADLTDLYKLTNDFIPVTTSITLESSKMYVVYPLATDILLTLPAHGINDTNNTIVIHKVDSTNIVTVAGYGVSTYLTDADDSVIYMSNGSVWIPFSWRNNASANAYADSLISQTITNGVTDKVPSEDAVFDAIEKGFVKDAVVKLSGETLEVNKINLVSIVSDTTFTLPTASLAYAGKVLIVKLYTSPYSNLTISGAAHGDIILTKYKDSVIFSCVDTNETGDYFWFDVSKSVDIITQTITNGVTDKSPSEDAVFDALALKEPVITKNDLSTPLVWTSANGVASFQPIPVLGDLTYYFTNTSSDVATYYKQTTTPQVALTSLPFASVTNGQLLATFISEPNNPSRTSIPDGQYLNHLHLGKTGGTKDLQVRAEIWETTSAGVDIVKLADLGPSSILVGSGSTEYIIGYNTVEKTLSTVTSRIATKLYAVVGVSGSAPSVSIFQGDGSDSRSNLPAPVVDATNYVPYDNMLKDLTTGSKDIIISNGTASRIASLDASKKIVSLDTTTYPSLTELSYGKGVTSAIQTQLNAKAPIASPTFTGTVTTPDIVVSNATASTPAFFDAVDKLITTTAQLWGTWVQTWTSKATPVDADTIGFYNSASTFVGVKSTLLNLWTTYLLPKIQALNYPEYTVVTWSTDANYTITNTTAKYLFVDVTATLTAPRTLTFPIMSNIGATVIVRTNASVTSTNFINCNANYFNGAGLAIQLNSAYADYEFYSTTTIGGSGTYTTKFPQFTETSTALTASKILRAGTLGTSALLGRTPTLGTDGDFQFALLSNNYLGTGNGLIFNSYGGGNLYIPSVDTTQGYSWYMVGGSSSNYMRFFDGNPIRTGNIPALSSGLDYGLYFFECFTDTTTSYCAGYFSVSPGGIPSNLVFTKAPSNTAQLNVAIVTVSLESQIQITSTGYVVTKLTNTSSLNIPTELPTMFQRYSSNGQTQYWTGTGGLGVGHTSQDASAAFQVDSTTKGALLPRMTNAQRTAISSPPATGLLVYQTDGVSGYYYFNSTIWVRIGATSNIRQVDVQLFNYALQQDVSYVDAGTITTFVNLNNQLASATYQKFTYSAGTWTSGSVTTITFTAGVSTVSIAMAQYDFIRVVGVLAGANTQATLSIKTTIS
jgi:hypothetical protein